MSTTRSKPLDAVAGGPSYVLPKPGRGGSELVIGDRTGGVPSALQRHRDADIARSIGVRMGALVECQQQFLGELRGYLQELEESVCDAARVRLQVQARSALSVLEWCDAVQSDLRCESAWAERGPQPVALGAFCREVATRWSAGQVPIAIVGDPVQSWWGDAGRLAELVEAALALVADRNVGDCSITIEVDVRRHGASIRIVGSGEASEGVDATLVRVFRQNAERLGARVLPDALGPASTGLVLALPAAGD